MRIAYLDCVCGISGDMTLAALIDAGVDLEQIVRGIDSLGLPDVQLHVETVVKGGFRALQIEVEHPEQHAHRHLADITKLIEEAEELTKSQKKLALKIFQHIAEAEARVHGTTLDKIHFHEVGAIDSIVDIVGVAIGFDLLGVDEVISSPVPTGRGRIEIAHGICPVPAPGTAELLIGIPLVDLPVEAELTTPTGAAILKALVTRYSALPEMTVEAIGYGAGGRDFPDRANLLRLFVGESTTLPESDEVIQLETNLDDVSPEVIGYTKQKLFEAGAVEVFTTPIQMKKNRPGVLLSVLCRPSDMDQMEDIIFTETATFGIRRSLMQRSKRSRQSCVIETPIGQLHGKLGWRHGERPLFTPEFESCAKIASERRIPIREVYRTAEQAFTEHLEAVFEQHDHDHDHDGGHDDDCGNDHNQGHDHDHDGSHSHDHDHNHDNDVGHQHDHDQSHDHDGGHDHDHSHDHDHGKKKKKKKH